MSDLRTMTPRELARGLMRGNRAELKLGYSPANAALAVQRIHPSWPNDEARGYTQGFYDGMTRDISMVSENDPAVTENNAYRDGYRDGMIEGENTYPASDGV